MTVQRRRHVDGQRTMFSLYGGYDPRQVLFDVSSKGQKVGDHDHSVCAPRGETAYGAGQIGIAELEECGFNRVVAIGRQIC